MLTYALSVSGALEPVSDAAVLEVDVGALLSVEVFRIELPRLEGAGDGSEGIAGHGGEQEPADARCSPASAVVIVIHSHGGGGRAIDESLRIAGNVTTTTRWRWHWRRDCIRSATQSIETDPGSGISEEGAVMCKLEYAQLSKLSTTTRKYANRILIAAERRAKGRVRAREDRNRRRGVAARAVGYREEGTRVCRGGASCGRRPVQRDRAEERQSRW